MSKKSRNPNFDQTLEALRTHSFDVQPSSAVAGGMLVSKHGAGAVLVPAQAPRKSAGSVSEDGSGAGDEGGRSAAAFAERPGALVNGEVARLLDRGYQKFIKTSKFELPASAMQLQGIHLFSEELKQLTGAISLYNESLGTTSDLYEYDRLKGREVEEPTGARPWELTAGH